MRKTRKKTSAVKQVGDVYFSVSSNQMTVIMIQGILIYFSGSSTSVSY